MGKISSQNYKKKVLSRKSNSLKVFSRDSRRSSRSKKNSVTRKPPSQRRLSVSTKNSESRKKLQKNQYNQKENKGKQASKILRFLRYGILDIEFVFLGFYDENIM